MRLASKAFVLGCGVAALLAAPAFADEPPNYEYLEGGYLNVDVDDLDGSGDNYFVDGSFGGKFWHLNAYYANGNLGPDYDQNLWRVGLGWHGALGYEADFIGELDWVKQSIDGPGSSDSETGYRLVGGVRWTPIKLFELDGFANYNDVGDESDLSYEGRAILNIWKLGFGAAYEKFNDSDQWNGFVRFNFARR
ncbi:MAG TPA: hypothetical protein VMQ62_03675 [Dongiaceae bacterium]|nr:hypothetical protein [Dongiaceae bacterium]